MSTYYYVKFHTHHALAHLYEHLFVRAVYHSMWQQGMVEYLDYQVNGYTYQGYLLLEIICYSRAVNHAFAIEKMMIDQSDSALAHALKELSIEEGYEATASIDTLRSALVAIEEQPWRALDTVSIHPTGRQLGLDQLRRSSRLIRFRSTPLRTRRLELRLEYKEKDIPADDRLRFCILNAVLLDNLIRPLTEYLPVYYRSYTSTYKHSSLVVSGFFESALKYHPQVEEAVMLIQRRLTELLQRSVIERISAHLEQVDSTAGTTPDSEELVFATGLLVGGTGWRMVQDPEELRRVLSAMTVVLRLGKTERRIMLHSVLK